MEIEQKIRDFIRHELLFGKELTLSEETALIDTGIVDSVGVIRLANYIESEFGVVIEPLDFVPENFETISAIRILVTRGKGRLGDTHE